MRDTKNLILGQALDLMSEGFSVLPCVARQKEPAIRWKKYQSYRADEEMIREWFGGITDYNLAIVCGAVSGGLVVLDFDDEDLYTKWRRSNTVPDGTPIVRSSRGFHVYVRTDRAIDSHKVRGLDILGEGHYVLAPPSLHPSGARYELIEGSFSTIPKVPVEFFDGLAQGAEKAPDSGHDGGIAEGGRNSTLFSLGCRLRNAGESAEEVLAHLREANERNCTPPLDDKEIIEVSASVERYRETEDRLRAELRGLTLFQFGAQKDSLSARYNTDKTTLMKLFNKEQAAAQEGQGSKGGLPVPTDPEPLDEPVDGDELLHELRQQVRRFVVLDEDAATTVALWMTLTYLVDKASYLGILALESATKRCGKSTLLAVLRRLVHRAKSTANITSAALFRIIEVQKPTLLIDEADSFLKGNEDLRGILNAGVEPGGTVIRCVGSDGDYNPREYNVFAPKAIALIGKLPPTLEDRSFVVRMRRRMKDETVERLRGDRDLGFEMLRRKIVTWTAAITPGFAGMEPEVPSSLNDRAADRWRDLLRIADAAGGEWPERARRAAETLEVEREDDDGESKTLLLEDIRSIFERCPDQRAWHSRDLVGELTDLEGRPWAESNNGKPLTTYGLANLLDGFGVKSRQVKIERKNRQGYRVADFTDIFSRYLPKDDPSPTSQTNASPGKELSGSAEVAVGDAKGYRYSNTTGEDDTKTLPEEEIDAEGRGVGDLGMKGTKNDSLRTRMRISRERRPDTDDD